MEDLYTGDINEFVDWTTGINEITGSKIQGLGADTKISGQSIRGLILNKLKIPFVTYKDDSAGLIRFFSSETAKNLYLTYLNIGDEESLDKANDLILYNMDMPATYRIMGLDAFTAARYIIEGNSLSTNALLDINLSLEDSLGSSLSDVLTVAYEIKDSSGNITYKTSDQIETGKRVVKLIYRYLKSGENKVTVSANANNYNAKTSKTFSIYLVTFSINTNFTGYYSPLANGVPFSFDIFVTRSITNLPVVTSVYIDGSIAHYMDNNHSDAIWRYADISSNPTKRMELDSSAYQSGKKHVMTIKSIMEDPETGTPFPSNILTYEFEISPAEDYYSNVYINLTTSIANSSYSEESYIDVNGDTKIMPIIQSVLYLPTVINWGYNTDSYSLVQEADVEWAIRTEQSGNYNYEVIANIRGIKNEKPEPLTFIPSLAYSFSDDNSFLVARINNEEVAIYPIAAEQSSMNITELGNYSLKLSAYGKTNASSDKAQWTDTINLVYTTFSLGVVFDGTNGWNDNSLLLKGSSSYAIVDYCPFPSIYNGTSYNVNSSGATFEIDFKPEYVSNENDILISIGDTSRQHIRITANSAGFYTGETAVVKTNFKSGERIKLAFIFNKYSEIAHSSNLIYIVNNGILERAVTRGNATLTDDNSRIKLGGSNSSVRIYMIRAYRYDLTPKLALDNYMFDNASDINLLSRNDIYGNSSEVTYAGMQGKQDIIVIEGDLTNILSNKDAKENATVNIRRESNLDSLRNFTIENCRIRNHGQSTLSYPITSIKMWFNKSNKFDEQTGTIELTPNFNCQNQQYLGLNKNRYIFKQGAIPSNKFVLQANYADSSGTHNGSLLRLINDTWYNAKFGQDNQFKLRTAPLLFTSGAKITHNNESLNEDGSWIEGVYNVKIGSSNYISSYRNKTWPEITGKDFPYQIRIAPDSFPCTVFYRDTSTSSLDLKLLGLYVFMDDKKSDFVFGERSIYNIDDFTDPFCLKIENSKKDKNEAKVWDNEKVLQIEVVYPNSPLTSYSSKVIASKYTLDENDNILPAEDATLLNFNDVTQRDSSGNPIEYLWEQHFELIYPDKEDIVDKNDNFDSAKFTLTVLPFEAFLNWITDVGALRTQGAKLGTTGAKSYVTQAELDKFIAEAHDHLDLYKLAAYYVFFLRFGLVDSVERNAQLKTYDGQHWHYEPWDMDIALGTANNGVIAYDPPLSRDSKRSSGAYVFAGRTATQSNVLWDCLESWDYWANTIVPEVAQALYNAGLTYSNAIKMFDQEYVERWSETLYNESGLYKYIEATSDPKYRPYLNGARTSHRHWWLSKSMNYYDAKWECGDFTKNSISFRIGKAKSNNEGVNPIKIYPTLNTFFELVYGAEGNRYPVGAGLVEASVESGGEALIDTSLELFEDKQPAFIYGATSIERLDLSGLLNTESTTTKNSYTDINFGGSYDEVLGAQIKELNLGAQCTPNIYEYPNSNTYESNLTVGENTIAGMTEGENPKDALLNLEILDVIGWRSSAANSSDWLSNLFHGQGYDRKNIHTLYAMGCTMATEFASSIAGNNFIDLRLPNSITTLIFTNSSWQNLSFWDSENISATRTRYTKVGIPATINSISFKGTTGKNECALQLVLDWIDSIEATLPLDHTEQDLLDILSTKILIVDLANWGTGNVTLTYNDLLRLSAFGGDGSLHPIKGYVLLLNDSVGMTTARVSKLLTLFGENVFNIGTTNANLVVDYLNNLIVISVSSVVGLEPITLEGDNIWIKEPNTAKLNATHFTLTSGLNNNQIFDRGENDPTLTSNYTENKYIWAFVDSLDAPSNTYQISAELSYAFLEKQIDGSIRLRTTEGNGNDYILYVRVYYGKYINDVLLILYDTIAVNIKGVTYPSDYVWRVTGIGGINQFKYSTAIAQSLFGNTFAQRLGNNADIYIFNTSGLKLEFSLRPTEEATSIDPVTGRTIINWTANPNNENIQYGVAELGNSTYLSSNMLNMTPKETFSLNTGLSINIGMCLYLTALDNAINKGIPILVSGSVSLPDAPILFQINGIVRIGGKNPVTKTIYFIIINDSIPIITGTSNVLPTVLWNKYCDLYSLAVGAALNMYRTHLLSLYGTLDFSNQTTLASLVTNKYDSVLKYIPYVSSLNFEGCTSLPYTDLNTNNSNFDFSSSVGLTTLNLKGCSGLNGADLDFTGCTNLTSLDTRDTSIGVTLGNNSPINSLLLGSPITLSIDSPAILGDSSTNISILSTLNLEDLSLINVNAQGIKGFSLFNKLYNPELPSPLPEGYTPVKYIASTKTGGLYINLNLQLWNEAPISYTIDMKINLIGAGKDNNQKLATLLGSNNESKSTYPGFVIRKDSNNVSLNKNPTVTSYGNIGQILVIRLRLTNLNVETHDKSVYLFCGLNDSGSPFRYSEARIYYCKIKSLGALVRDLLPCLNPNNVPGLYDIVNNIFYSSDSDIPFIYQI